MDPVGHLALALVVILVAGKLGGDLAVRLGQPSVLGEPVAGVLVGNLSLVGFSGLETLKTDASVGRYIDRHQRRHPTCRWDSSAWAGG